ncbi:MAG: zinc ABC transporter substrate-binding protein [Planctomycetaceae bacterium]|nr:zinc ABC transporter substrate-binding protein [Planctomycetaceae bacterium]
MNKRQIPSPLLALFSVLLLALAGCTGPSAPSGNLEAGKSLQKVVCTTGMVGDMVQEILGPEVEVQVLMAPGVDPHLFRPSPRDIAALSQADAVFYNGLHLEAGLSSTLENMAKDQKRLVYAVSEGLTAEDGLIEVGGSQFDPHFWNDLELWEKAAGNLAIRLGEYQPELKAEFEKRAARYQEKLNGLLMASREAIGAIPESQRVLISAHDAFEYFGRSLGLEVAAVQGISTNTEATVGQIEKLVTLIVERKIPSIFAESTVSSKAVLAIISGCKQKGFEPQLGGTLYSDALGPPGSGAESFMGMYESNVQTISSALKPAEAAAAGN